MFSLWWVFNNRGEKEQEPHTMVTCQTSLFFRLLLSVGLLEQKEFQSRSPLRVPSRELRADRTDCAQVTRLRDSRKGSKCRPCCIYICPFGFVPLGTAVTGSWGHLDLS